MASALASALPRRAASRAAVVTASRRAAAILESTSEEVSRPTAGRKQSGRWRPPWRPACSPEMEASLLASLATVAANYGLKTVVDQHSLDIAARITPLEVDTKVANALLGAVTAAALASELGVVGRDDVLFVAATPSSTSKADWSALLERPVVSELCSAAMLLPCALPVRGGQGRRRGQGAIAGASALLSEASSAVTLSSRDWMAAALLPDAAVFTARSVT